MLREIENTFAAESMTTGLRTSRSTVFAARNLLDVFPELDRYWQVERVTEFLREIVGPSCGLVRVLYFDKPSHRSWNLPWHKDMTIAVRNHRSEGSGVFSKPTTKAGVHHVEASEEILESMVTLRIHLDDVTKDNGPLEVIPGSHLTGKQVKQSEQPPEKILAKAGDVLAMRPLISHASGHSSPDMDMHRRILHLEFAGQQDLPDGYEWKWFVPAKWNGSSDSEFTVRNSSATVPLKDDSC